MKRKNIFYWTTTGLVSAAFVMSSMMYLTRNPELVKAFSLIGFPLSFMPFLGLAKLTGAIALINPWFAKLREWAYAGFTFVLLGAVWIHIATATSFTAPAVFLVLLGTSYYFNAKKSQVKTAPIFATV